MKRVVVAPRHRRRHAIERDPVEERGHVIDRIDRDPDAAHLTGSERMIRVVADLRRQVECDAQTAYTMRQQIAITRIRLGRRPEAGVLAHRPQPPAIHRRLGAAGVGEFTGEADVLSGINPCDVRRMDVRPRQVRRAHAAIVNVAVLGSLFFVLCSSFREGWGYATNGLARYKGCHSVGTRCSAKTGWRPHMKWLEDRTAKCGEEPELGRY